ncbi:MAG: sodium/proton-translocating pyrophosphatase, partial [Planctomycetota bacterium]|nr:sodium/proton-translocating pyrophosphatase [Planctomycetota bacterium]
GLFTIASQDEDPALFGGLLLASGKMRLALSESLHVGQTFAFDSDLDEMTNTFAIELGGYTVQIAPADRARIEQVLAFYDVSLMNPWVLGGIFLGVLLAFVFCAMTMQAVGRAAYRMMNEARRQFAIMRDAFRKQGMSEADIADPTTWPIKVDVQGHQYPDYAECVKISTAGAQREMIVPSLLAIIVPIVVGLILGVGGVMGLLVGGLTSGFAVAIFMANAGGAWDNAKKWIEKGNLGGKGSDAHKASVVGDTVGDPFKDTSGPSLNILIKLIAIVSVVFAGLIVKFSPMISGWIGLG